MTETDRRLRSLAEFSDKQLPALVTLTGQRAQHDSDAAWRGLWHELAFLAAEEVDRRAAAIHALNLDAHGLSAEGEVGRLLGDDEPGWSGP